MSARSVTFEVGAEDSGERLDKVLTSRVGEAGLSRSALARLCDEGLVTVRGVTARASSRLRAGDTVSVTIPPPPPSEAQPEDIPLDVVFEDEHVLVVNKPAGMVVHPARGHATGTLVNAVLHHGDVDDDEDPARPGIVHRIDRLTSGLLVIARTPLARERLVERFKRHDITRSYVALTDGVPAATTVSYDTPYGRHPHDRVKFSSRVSDGRRAVTHVTVVERLVGGRAALVRCALETGRTHQIRVHLADAGFPLLGDPVYGRPHPHRAARAVAEALGRQALHAETLGFAHPVTGENLSFTAPPPDDFARALAALRDLDP